MSSIAAREDVARFLDALEAAGSPPLETLPVEQIRAITKEQATGMDMPPVPLATIRNLTLPGLAGDIAVRLYDPRKERAAGPLVLFFHGGGFVFGDLETHDSFCTWLADAFDLPVLATDYRLAPEHPFPAAVEDVEVVARWAADNPGVLDREVTSLIACGDSAGGNLAIVLAGVLERRPAAVPLIAQLAIYPYCGGGMDWPSYRAFGEGFMLSRGVMKWFEQCYGAPAGGARHDCFAGPVPKSALAMLTAGLDPLRDPGRAHAERVAKTGARVLHREAQGMIHGFVNMRAAMPSCVADLEAFVEEAHAFIKVICATGPTSQINEGRLA
ncbi:MAG: alpha/beta hydrolase fold domain-containing protein [Novosphingobium sp.]